jgi:glutaredoxin 3
MIPPRSPEPAMNQVTLYTTPFCGYCLAAKRLLGRKGVPFHEIDVAGDPARRAEMTERARGRRTVPQIFVGERHVGGFDDMAALERAGELDPLLGS